MCHFIMELIRNNRKFVSYSPWCTVMKNWAPKATIKNGCLQSLAFRCCTPEGMQKKTLYCHQRMPHLGDTQIIFSC